MQTKRNSWTDDDHCTVDGAYALILRVSSFCGLAPLRFKRHGNGYIVSLSINMCIYSYVMVTILVAFTFFGLVSELEISTHVNTSSRLSQVMSCIEITAIMVLASVGIYGAPSRMRSMIKFMNIIALVDKKICYQYSSWWERRLCAGFGMFILWFTVIHINDMSYHALQAKIVNKEWDLLAHYLGCYILWYFVVILKVQFSITVMVVYSRFKAVKEALNVTSKFLTETYLGKSKDPDTNIFMTRVPSDSRPEKMKIAFVRQSVIGDPDLHPYPSDVIHRISSLHVELCDMVHLIESSYSTLVVIMLIVALFHLIVTPYFTIMEVQKWASSGHWMYLAVLQIAWYITHIMTLFLIEEPCYYTTAEVNEIENLVCRMIVTAPSTGTLASRLEHLALQLMLKPVSFNPKGLCTLERPLIASIFGAVTTYLVILIQFQKYDI